MSSPVPPPRLRLSEPTDGSDAPSEGPAVVRFELDQLSLLKSPSHKIPIQIFSPSRGNTSNSLMSPSRRNELVSPGKAKSMKVDSTPRAKFWRDQNATDKRRSFLQSPEPPRDGAKGPLNPRFLLSPLAMGSQSFGGPEKGDMLGLPDLAKIRVKRVSAAPIPHPLAESKEDPRSPSVPRSPTLAIMKEPISHNASALVTLQTLFKGGCISNVEKALLKAMIIREDDLTFYLLQRHAKGDENALPAIKEMIRELQVK